MEISSTLPATVCSQCVTATLESARFVLRCRETCQKWRLISDYLLNLEERLADSTTTLCVLIDNDSISAIQTAASIKTTSNAHGYINKKKKGTGVIRDSRITGKRFECPECQKDFSSIYILNKHLKENGQQMCQYCGKILDCAVFLQHLRKHGRTEFTCERCNDTFIFEGKYKRHVKVCNRRGSNVCVECSERFTTETNLITHISKKHRQSICKGCNRRFKSRACFKNHKNRCLDSQNLFGKYICDYCNKVFTIKNSLKLHIRYSHILGKDYQCTKCGKTFTNPFHLEEHDNTHNPVPDRYVCEICPAKFATRRGYQRHHKKHVGKNGAIITTVSVRRHAAETTNQKLYKCMVCQFVSVRKAIRRHLKNIHHILPWEIDGDRMRPV